ncbi:MAG: MarR family transcriptional regulator [Anaerolineales bacterium]|nr:MarR family transcriptional regulator [Anaerolineales bacterium]
MANEIHKPIRIAPGFEQKFPGASAQATETAMNLVRTADLLVKRIGELVQPFDLTPSSGLVLGMLADAAEPLPPNEIAARLIISRATVTGLLDSLERRGYIERRPHAGDRRMLLIALTDAGRAVAQQFREVVHRRQREWLGALSEREQKQLLATLRRLQGALGEAGE